MPMCLLKEEAIARLPGYAWLMLLSLSFKDGSNRQVCSVFKRDAYNICKLLILSLTKYDVAIYT